MILEANRAASILLNMEPRYLSRKPLINFIPREERPAFRAELSHLQRTPYVSDWEMTIQARTAVPSLGGRLVLATDGITEARRHKELLNMEGLIRLVTSSQDLSLDEAGHAILSGARAFAGGRLQDDACLLITERIGE